MKKRTLFSVFLSIFSLVSFAQSTSLSGAGTSTEPYLIQSIDDLKFLRDQTNLTTASDYKGNGKYFKLTADINLENEIWIPMGTGGTLTYIQHFRGYLTVSKK